MSVEPRLRINEPTVIHQTVDDQVVMINLDRGVYYSLVGIGADLWGRLERRATRAEMAAWVRGRYHGDADEITREIGRLVELLREEALIVEDPSAELDATPSGLADEAGTGPGGRRPFEPPRLERFTDLQDLLLLDPIHDVDEGGWPGEPRRDAPGSGVPG